MRLRDLDPHWITFANCTVPFYYGVSFLCPHCEHTACPTCGHHRGKRIAISFWPPIDPEQWEHRITRPPEYNLYPLRSAGETFDTLTINGIVGVEGHWNGYIKNGEVT